MSPQVKQFLTVVGGLAARLNFPVLIVVRDPVTKIVSFTGTPGALDNMRPEITAKIAPSSDDEATTAWPSD